MASEGLLLPQEVIRKKRDGLTLEPREIEFLVAGLADGSLSDAQVAAFAMAVFFNGMDMDERVATTRAMTRSGIMIDWRQNGLDGPIVDKHSTGGVGDKVSLMLAPILAACGAFVPMISGRGLGHTGGTLDKLDAIPGYQTGPDLETFQRVVGEVGCAIIGQTPDLAPADGRFYGIRDVTATVESIPLITASILSKKLAAGLDGLCMDVKFGNGAFAQSHDDAVELARSIVAVGNGAGLATRALLTDMNQVLGHSAGNGVEISEAVAYLTGVGDEGRDPRLDAVTIELAAECLTLAGLATDLEAGRAAAIGARDSGTAAERFADMVSRLGGPADFLERPGTYLAAAPVTLAVESEAAGYVGHVDTRAIGVAIIGLGGGRSRADQKIDHRVGLTQIAGLGTAVGPGAAPFALVHANSEEAAAVAAAAIRGAYGLTDKPPEATPIFAGRLTETEMSAVP